MELLAKLARVQFADAAAPLERHPDSILRAHSLRLGRDLRDGLHRRERKTSGRAHNGRNARGDSVHHSGIALRRQTWPGAVRHLDLHHVYAFPNQSDGLAHLPGAADRVRYSWV